MMRLFKPELSDGAKNCEAFWDFSSECLPIPKKELQCGGCDGKDSLILRDVHYERRETHSPNPYRVNLMFKCTVCSRCFVHGVIINEYMWNNRIQLQGGGHVTWRMIKEVLRQKGIKVD